MANEFSQYRVEADMLEDGKVYFLPVRYMPTGRVVLSLDSESSDGYGWLITWDAANATCDAHEAGPEDDSGAEFYWDYDRRRWTRV